MCKTKTCNKCQETKPVEDFCIARSSKDGRFPSCRACLKKYNDAKNPSNNPNRMYVNGQYVSKKHPLWKAGRYIVDGFFGEAVVESDTSKRGYIYCITNPAWPGWVKVGKAVEDAKRFNSYQTYSPFRDYVLEWSVEVEDVHAVEAAFHRGRKANNGEWYEMSKDEALSIIQTVPHVGETNAEEDNRVVHDTVGQD